MKSQFNLKTLVILLAILGFVGFIDASYLTAKHYLGTPIPCSIFDGCDAVTNSPYATVGPVPIALIGAIYYLLIFLSAIYYLDSKKPEPLVFVAFLTIGGLLASGVLVYLQIFILKALCLYCMVSALITLILFILGQLILRKLRNSKVVEIL